MKAILMSIRPQYVAKILNGEKTIEIRKKFPKDYVGWVYIYCCKQKKYEIGCHINYHKVDGKVVARFWCDKVEHIEPRIVEWNMKHQTDTIDQEQLLERSQLSLIDLMKYCGGVGYAIHITKLEIFAKPKEISEFRTKHYPQYSGMVKNETHYELVPLTRSPQSFMFIEV